MSPNRWFQVLVGTAAIWLLTAGGAGSTQTAARFPCSNDNETFCGDGGPAANARLLRPLAVTARRAGGYFVADSGNQAIRMVLPSGVISTVAGIGVSGFSGDHGPANAAQLDNPNDVAPVGGGALLIADTGNNVIRRVSPTGTITTVAGHPGRQCSGHLAERDSDPGHERRPRCAHRCRRDPERRFPHRRHGREPRAARFGRRQVDDRRGHRHRRLHRRRRRRTQRNAERADTGCRWRTAPSSSSTRATTSSAASHPAASSRACRAATRT